MLSSRWSAPASVAASLLTLALCPALRAADNDAAYGDLAGEIQALETRIADLEQKQGDTWLTQDRTSQIRQIVQEVLADVKTREQFADGPAFGYDNGFFIQSPDQNFRMVFNGYMQFRYTFGQNDLKNANAFTTVPKSGDVSGFDFRYMRLTFSGNAFTPNLTYLFTGDFAGNSSNANDFQVVDAYVAYRFNDLLNVRAGAFLVPFSRLEYISSGLSLVDFPELLNPFDPARAMGVSVFGDLYKNRLLYEININDGPQSNHDGRVAEIGGANDNRPCFAARLQYFGGAGTPADFADEADLRKDTSTFAWLVEGAVGYDSANNSANAFPGKQANESLPGVSAMNSPGFVSYPLNGDLYRATIDGQLKYRGWEILGAAFFQQVNENPGAGITSADGSTAASIPSGFSANSSFFQASYYAQVGYMLTPKWEVVGRAGQLLTEGGPNRMEEYSVGLNYFALGKNVKLQGDVTYIPNESGVSNPTFGTAADTQDVVARLQLQVKF